MLKKLRFQFIAIVMASVATVLIFAFVGICINEYRNSMSDIEQALGAALELATQSRGSEHGQVKHEGYEAAGKEPDLALQEIPSDSEGVSEPQGQHIGGKNREASSLIPIGVYTIDPDTGFSIVSDSTTGHVDSEVLSSIQETVLEADDGIATIAEHGLIFQKLTTGTADYVAFVDSSHAKSWHRLALSLAVAALVVLAVFLAIAWFLSKWALRPVEEAWEAQRQFIADASHELKTPLTVVLANTAILLRHPERSVADQSKWIESTQVEAQGMQELVNEMLELAQVESRANPIHEQIDYSDLVNGEILQFESVAFEKGCTLFDDIADGLMVIGDSKRLNKMVATLLENALKYVDAGGEVRVSLKLTKNGSLLEVANTGSTISPDDLSHIFDRFYRTDKARTSGAGGYGLGLAIARETAREHGGDITCASNAEGTVFTVELPRA